MVPVLDDRSTAKSAETTENDRLPHFMVQPLQLKKHGEFGVASQFVIGALRLQFTCLLGPHERYARLGHFPVSPAHHREQRAVRIT